MINQRLLRVWARQPRLYLTDPDCAGVLFHQRQVATYHGYAARTTVLNARKVWLIIQNEHNVPKDDFLEFEGLVTEILPDARYRVQLDNGHQLVASVAAIGGPS